MNILLNDNETRVLGSLLEKDVTTPDYYPLSLNALVNACNQKNNRDPVMNLVWLRLSFTGAFVYLCVLCGYGI